MYSFSFLMVIICLLTTTFTDPGIIPRRAFMELNNNSPEYYFDG